VTDSDPLLYPNANGEADTENGVSRRRLLAGSATAGAVATTGCLGGGGGGGDEGGPTVFVFNTGDGTVSLLDPETDSLVGTQSLGFSSSFPSNQYTPDLTDESDDSLCSTWAVASVG
jgi:hypothetical protein